MNTVTRIDKQAAKQISDAALAALEPLAESLGLTVEAKGGSYDPSAGTYTPKFVFSIEGSERMAFENAYQYVWVDGDGPRLAASDYGKTFKAKGQTFTLIGVNLNAPKYPLVARGEDGRTYKFTTAIIPKIKGA